MMSVSSLSKFSSVSQKFENFSKYLRGIFKNLFSPHQIFFRIIGEVDEVVYGFAEFAGS